MGNENFNYHEKVIQSFTKSYQGDFQEEKKFLQENIKEGSKILEVGCGDGRSLKYIQDVGGEIVGIDNSKEAVNLAKSNFSQNNNIKIIEADARNLPFEDNSFDNVICMTTPVNFGENKYKIYTEIKRVLRNEGSFFLSVFNENALYERIEVYKKLKIPFKESSKKGTIIFNFEGSDNISEQFSKEEIETILDKAGFEIEDIKKGEIFYLIKCKKK